MYNQCSTSFVSLVHRANESVSLWREVGPRMQVLAHVTNGCIKACDGSATSDGSTTRDGGASGNDRYRRGHEQESAIMCH